MQFPLPLLLHPFPSIFDLIVCICCPITEAGTVLLPGQVLYHRLATLTGIFPHSIAGASNELLSALRAIYVARLRQLSHSP
ncbi:hypothetical protein I7I50_00830 [Histoplasma capsulatum G186AR]|uniref:Secreted protein n=1 Tax=Ajellomyces capsulatus TaxID=5037 RepID=A0A8H8CV72_AJECA|nr:hypothetical protein I7I52_08098 [Histoplasma capsulatum]QSS72856.1 hypothetical protein I7I50_00830 [Histoplasma capsulatum G186AR]